MGRISVGGGDGEDICRRGVMGRISVGDRSFYGLLNFTFLRNQNKICIEICIEILSSYIIGYYILHKLNVFNVKII